MELERYKANRSSEINAKYVGLIKNVIDKYNKLLSNVAKSRLLINKPVEIARIKALYVSEYQGIMKQINGEISKISMPKQIEYTNVSRKALLVGINYIGTKVELKGCINDVNGVSNILTRCQSVVKLTDTTDMKPTRNNILNEFKKLLNDSKAGDCLMFLFSGHGSQMRDLNKDELDGRDECIYTLDEQFITDDEIHSYIKAYLKLNVTLFAIFDSCHSGTMMDLKYNYIDYIENPKNIDTVGNVIMISGCKDDQTSADALIDRKYQGAMTWSFLNNIQPNITWRQLIVNMNNSLAKSSYTQIPKLSSGKIIDLDSKFIFS